jgi:hypothetical protein
MGGTFNALEKMKNTYKILVIKPQGRRPLGKPRYKWVDNIKMDLLKTGWKGMQQTQLAQDKNQRWALVNM